MCTPMKSTRSIVNLRAAFICTLVVVAGSASAQQKIFDAIRPSYELSEFIASSEFVPDTKSANTSFLNAAKQQHVDLFAVDPAPGQSSLPAGVTKLSFSSRDGEISFDVITSSDGNYLFQQWKEFMKESNYKTDMRNDQGTSVYVEVKTPKNSALGALVFTGRNTIRLKINLPFAIPELPSKLDTAKVSYIIRKFHVLHGLVEALAKAYVKESEFFYYANGNTPLSREQRLYGLIQFWTEVKYNFAFFDQVPGLNWDKTLAEYLPLVAKDQTDMEYYRTLEKLCALLKDGHTNIYPPASVRGAIDSPPLELVNIQGKPIVKNVAKELVKEIPIGSEIVTVEGLPAGEYMKANVLPYISSSTEHILIDNGTRDLLDGAAGTNVQVTFKTPDGQLKQHTLQRNSDGEMVTVQKRLKLFEFKRLPGNIAYVALNSFGDEKIISEFEQRIDSINLCKALIIDLRRNGGGNSWNGYGIINHLTTKPYVGSKWRTREHRPAFKAWGSFLAEDFRMVSRLKEEELSEWDRNTIKYYRGDMWFAEQPDTIKPGNGKKIKLPLVVLTGHNTASAAEDFLVALDGLHIATLVGAKTYGSTGQPLILDLPGGGTARICTKRDEYADGRQFVGYGVKPDVAVENTVEDLLNGTDTTLKKGVEVLMKK